LQVERVPVDKITTHPENPRKGNVSLIMESLAEYDLTQPLVVQRSTGYVLAGNHRLRAAIGLGWTEVDVVYADLDDVRAKKYMLMDNRTADLGTYDEELLAELLASMSDDLLYTGYTPDDMDDLLAAQDQLPVLPPAETGASYAESPDEYRERVQRGEGAQPLIAFGIRDFMVKCSQPEYEEIHELFRTLRLAHGEDLVMSELLLAVLRAAVAQIG
jgi:ParB-like nuclease family protein